MTLFHYTCDHGYSRIMRDGVVKPGVMVLDHPLSQPLAWFTDLDGAVVDALGLTSISLSCDRTAHRITVASGPPIIPWMTARCDSRYAALLPLEETPGAMPRHWFVSESPVAVLP